MTDVLQVAVLGLGSGGLYALLALGLVLIYRGSGVVNFSHGAIATVAGFLLWELRDRIGLPLVPAAVLAVAVAVAIGAAFEYLIMRKMAAASGLSKLIATLALLIVLQTAVAIIWSPDTRIVGPVLPEGSWRVGPLAVGWDRLIVLVLAVGLTVGLAVAYRRTRFGLATSAAAENTRALATLGFSPARISLVNWSLGAGLAGLAGVLMAPMIGLQAGLGTIVLIPTLAVALVGNLRSFGAILLAGLALGVVQAGVSNYVPVSGLEAALPLLVIVAVMVLRGRGIPVRGGIRERPAVLGTGRVDVRVVLAVVAGWGALVLFVLPSGWLEATITMTGGAILILSVVVVTGYTGQLSLAQYMIGAFGTLVTVRLLAEVGLPFVPALLLGALSGVAFGSVFGLLALRTRGINLALVTLALGVAVNSLLFARPEIAGEADGFILPPLTFLGWDIDPFLYPERYAFVCTVLFALLCVGVANLRRGRVGRRLVAVRSSERAAASLGINVAGAKLYAFGVAAFIACIGVTLVASRNAAIVFNGGASPTFDPFTSIQTVIYAVFGGVGFVGGSIVGASLQPGSIPDYLVSGWVGDDLALWLTLAGGLFVLVHMRSTPDGVVASMTARLRGRTARRRTARTGAATAERTGAPVPDEPGRAVPPQEIRVEDLTVRFGGVTAVRNASLSVRPGTITGLIGPNGAGKTTIIDAVMGYVRPAGGRVLLDGTPITEWSIDRRAVRGVQRTFQGNELFEELTVEENLRVAADRWSPARYLADLVRPGGAAPTATMLSVIREFDLADVLGEYPRAISFGRRRLVAIARSVSAEPSVLLLDEPGAGLSGFEKEELGAVVRRLAHERGMAVLIVEHDVDLVMRLCDAVVAVAFGEVIAAGPPEVVRADPQVVEAYLGTTGGAATRSALQAGP